MCPHWWWPCVQHCPRQFTLINLATTLSGCRGDTTRQVEVILPRFYVWWVVEPGSESSFLIVQPQSWPHLCVHTHTLWLQEVSICITSSTQAPASETGLSHTGFRPSGSQLPSKTTCASTQKISFETVLLQSYFRTSSSLKKRAMVPSWYCLIFGSIW